MKIGALIRSTNFLSLEVAPCLYKSTKPPWMECWCHVWAGAFNCYLDMLDKLQKWVGKTVDSQFTVCLEPLPYRWIIASLSLLYRYYFSTCSSELVEMVPLPHSWGRSTCYSKRLHCFSVTIPRCYVNSFFPCTARLWNSLPKECFPLTYDLNGFKSRLNRHLCFFFFL